MGRRFVFQDSSKHVSAVQQGYSKLLISDNVVPDIEAVWPITSMDWFVMALGAVRERTEKQWRSMLRQAGPRFIGISYEQEAESLIEIEIEV